MRHLSRQIELTTCVLAAACGLAQAQNPCAGAGRDRSLHLRTLLDTVDKVLAASKPGVVPPVPALDLLKGMAGPLADLTAVTDCFEAEAMTGQAQCLTATGRMEQSSAALTRLAGEMKTQAREWEQFRNPHDRQLKQFIDSYNESVRRRDDIRRTIAGLQPGDAAKRDTLAKELGELEREIPAMEATIAVETRTSTELPQRVKKFFDAVAVVTDRQRRAHEQLTRMKAAVIFLNNADDFFRRLNTIVSTRSISFNNDLRNSMIEIEAQVSPTSANGLRAALIDFIKEIDSGSSFLMKDASLACPLSDQTMLLDGTRTDYFIPSGAIVINYALAYGSKGFDGVAACNFGGSAPGGTFHNLQIGRFETRNLRGSFKIYPPGSRLHCDPGVFGFIDYQQK
jgi:hypothetical protein